MNNDHVISRFIYLYQVLNKDNLDLLKTVYAEDAVFIDPLHKIEGLNALQAHFLQLYRNLDFCYFDIQSQETIDDKGFLYWTMYYEHPKIAGGKRKSLEGHTLLSWRDNKVIYHRDYFDMGELLYRNLPLVGQLIKAIDAKAGGRK